MAKQWVQVWVLEISHCCCLAHHLKATPALISICEQQRKPSVLRSSGNLYLWNGKIFMFVHSSMTHRHKSPCSRYLNLSTRICLSPKSLSKTHMWNLKLSCGSILMALVVSRAPLIASTNQRSAELVFGLWMESFLTMWIHIGCFDKENLTTKTV